MTVALATSLLHLAAETRSRTLGTVVNKSIDRPYGHGPAHHGESSIISAFLQYQKVYSTRSTSGMARCSRVC